MWTLHGARYRDHQSSFGPGVVAYRLCSPDLRVLVRVWVVYLDLGQSLGRLSQLIRDDLQARDYLSEL